MQLAKLPSFDFWIIGYGNIQRRDDGIGPYIVNGLQPFFKHRNDVHLLVQHQLEPDVIDELKNAGMLLFVDATVDALAEGRQWDRIQPELKTMPYLTHQITPSLIMGLLQSLYLRNPPAWKVSVQGDEFSFGGALTDETKKRAQQVMAEITDFILTYLAEQDNITLNRINWKSKA
jgi:hydrogenase maturation protease